MPDITIDHDRNLQVDENVRARILTSTSPVITQIRSQIHSHVVRAMADRQSSGWLQEEDNYQKRQGLEKSILGRMANSLLSGHCKDLGYLKTRAIFLPECGTPAGLLVDAKDVVNYLGFTDEQKEILLNPELSLDEPAKSSFLLRMLSVIKQTNENPKVELAIQPAPKGTAGGRAQAWGVSALEERLRELDEEFRRRSETEETNREQLAEERLAAYQMNADKVAKESAERDLERWRRNELQAMKDAERQRYDQKVRSTRETLEKEYSDRQQRLRLLEEETQQKLRRREEEMEKNLYELRQRSLRDVETIRRQQEIEHAQVLSEREQLKWREDRAREKEAKASDMYSNVLNEISSQVGLKERDLLLKLEGREQAVSQKERELRSMEENLDERATVLKERRKHITEMAAENETLKAMNARLETENIALSTRVEALTMECKEAERQLLTFAHLREPARKLDELSTDVRRKNLEIDELNHRVNEQQRQLERKSEAESRGQQLVNALKRYRTKCEDLQERLRRELGENRRLEGEIGRLRLSFIHKLPMKSTKYISEDDCETDFSMNTSSSFLQEQTTEVQLRQRNHRREETGEPGTMKQRSALLNESSSSAKIRAELDAFAQETGDVIEAIVMGTTSESRGKMEELSQEQKALEDDARKLMMALRKDGLMAVGGNVEVAKERAVRWESPQPAVSEAAPPPSRELSSMPITVPAQPTDAQQASRDKPLQPSPTERDTFATTEAPTLPSPLKESPTATVNIKPAPITATTSSAATDLPFLTDFTPDAGHKAMARPLMDISDRKVPRTSPRGLSASREEAPAEVAHHELGTLDGALRKDTSIPNYNDEERMGEDEIVAESIGEIEAASPPLDRYVSAIRVQKVEVRLDPKASGASGPEPDLIDSPEYDRSVPAYYDDEIDHDDDIDFDDDIEDDVDVVMADDDLSIEFLDD
eukprot:Clim_evm31s191 gene=Clim_evmTU31s191